MHRDALLFVVCLVIGAVVILAVFVEHKAWRERDRRERIRRRWF